MAHKDANTTFDMYEADNGLGMMKIADWAERFPWLRAGFTTRKGGVSQEPWSSLNCGLHVGDADEDVAENRTRIAASAGIAFERWTCAEQVHGNEVAVVQVEDAGAGRLSRADAIQAKDALITNVPDVMLNAFYADCVPLWFVDPVHRAVGVAHAGWRGAVADIAGETVRAMQRHYSSKPSELHAAIGPCILSCCYEVDEKVAAQIDRTSHSLQPSTHPGKFMLDLAKFNRHKLTEAGIMPNHIELSGYCTSCRTDLFFSHRKEQGRTGRMTAWITRIE